MELKEFTGYVTEIENFYGSELSETEKTIWYNNLKTLSLERFNYIISIIYKTSKFMPKLADILQINKQIPYENSIEPKKKIGKCNKCNGTGYIIYTKEVDGKEYQYAMVCDCGRQERYSGKDCENAMNQSKYYIPTLQETGLKYTPRVYSKEEIIKSMNMIQKNNLISEDLKNIIGKAVRNVLLMYY